MTLSTAWRTVRLLPIHKVATVLPSTQALRPEIIEISHVVRRSVCCGELLYCHRCAGEHFAPVLATRRAMIRQTDAPRYKRRWIVILGFVLLPAALELWGCGSGVSSPTAPESSITVPDPSTATSLTYGANIAPILASDCTYCHSSSNRN